MNGHHYATHVLVSDRRDRYVAEAEAFHLGRDPLAPSRRASILSRIRRRQAARPVTRPVAVTAPAVVGSSTAGRPITAPSAAPTI